MKSLVLCEKPRRVKACARGPANHSPEGLCASSVRESDLDERRSPIRRSPTPPRTRSGPTPPAGPAPDRSTYLRTMRSMATTEDKRGVEGGAGEWKRELYDATPERPDELSSTISGLENEPLYTPENVEVDYERDLGYPGVYPFTRGVYPSMYRGKLWTMRQFAGFGTAEETNERFRYLLDHGQTGLSTAFDMPTLMGYDSDHPRSLGEVGREGVAIDSLA